MLIFRLGSIGDTVVALPCFHGIARAFPAHRRVLLTNALTAVRASSAESILNATGLIDEVIYYPVGDFSIKRMLGLMRAIRRLRPSLLIYLAERPTFLPVARDIVFFIAAGLRSIIGAPIGAKTRQCRVDPNTGELEFESDRLARILGRHFPVSVSPENWNLRLTEDETARADALISSIPRTMRRLAIAPGAKILAKDWGSGNWVQLLTSLSFVLNEVALIIVGALDERSRGDDLAATWSGPVSNLCGSLTPRETAAVLRRCDALICHDSGLMHLAASQETRCVALFGNYNRPRKWFPFGVGHRVIYEPNGILEISVQRVMDEIRSMFETGKHGSAER